ncbi:hypothetical protein TSMEX_007652 [Taenia solium]|eukprot:TsM_000339000 transcript=TsM_000339000 gene=TsM_000339000
MRCAGEAKAYVRVGEQTWDRKKMEYVKRRRNKNKRTGGVEVEATSGNKAASVGAASMLLMPLRW